MNRAVRLGVLVGLASLLGLASAPKAAAQSVRAPYLQQGTPDSMRVVWRTAAATDSVVCWGDAPDALAVRATGASGVTDHDVAITGLEPSTRYHYAVSSSGACPPPSAGDPEHYFRTAPPVGSPEAFTMWVVGDSGTGSSRQRAVFDAMRAEVGSNTPNLFVHVGDMAYSDGLTSEFDSRFFGIYAPLLQNTVTWPAMGNHEGHTSVSATESGPYYEAYVLPRAGEAGGLASGTEAYYSFDYANVHFVVLDSHQSSRAVDGPMLTWLANDLASTDAEWLIAFWHHPPYTKGSHDSDTESALRDMRQNALPILEAAGVDLVLGGHSHIYERSYLIHGAYDTPTTAGAHIIDPGDGRSDGDGAYAAIGNGAVYVVAGHGGTGNSGPGGHPVMFHDELDNGSCLVDVSGGSLTLRNINYNGVETDHFTLIRGDGIFLVRPVGGETYLAGSDVDIVWTSSGTSGQVRIEYSLDDGVTYAPVVESTEDDGSYIWTTPRRATTQARVRITDVSDASLSALSPRRFTLSAEADVLAIPPGGVWEYSDDGVDPGPSWSTGAGGWASGPAQLGYGDGDEATVLTDADPNHATAYFRQTITLSGVPQSARMRVLFDDGFAAFVNGTEVLSRNVADGLGNDVFASSASADDEIVEVEIDTAAFVEGDNVIAVLVKQANASSSDLSFDLSLSVRVRVTVDPDPVDAGVPGVDAGTVVLPDGAVARRDGGSPGVDAGGPVEEDGGCGCRVSGSRAPSALWLVPALALLWRRRRR